MIFSLSAQSILYFFSISGLLLTLFILYKLFLKPYILMGYYTKQGAIPIFFWQTNSYFQSWKDSEKHGDFYYTYRQAIKAHPEAKLIVDNFGDKPHLVVVDTEMAKEVLARHEIYQKDLTVLELFMDLARGAAGFGDVTKWKRGRRFASTAFNFEFVKDSIPVIVDTTQEIFDQWAKSKDYSNVLLLGKLGEITGEITGKTFFGNSFSEERLNGKKMTTLIQELAVQTIMEKITFCGLVFGTDFIRKGIIPRHKELMSNIHAFRKRCSEMIKEKEQNPPKEKNLLKIMMDLRGEEDDKISAEQIVGEFVAIFFAGTDTTSQLVTSTLYFLWKYPNAMQKVREEVEREFKDPKSLTLEHLNRMDYTMAVLKETLRIGGPTSRMLTRVTLKDDNLCGVHVKKGTLVDVFHDLFALMDKYYSRPTEWIPERWLPGNEFSEDGFKSEPYAFLPFSAGPRNCMGQHLALITARILVGLFLKTFNYSIPEDYDFKMVNRLLYEPLHPILVTVDPKKRE